MKYLLTVLFLLFSWAAQAQSTVVTTCGTVPQQYAAGSSRSPTMDINGNTCTSGGGGGGGAVTMAVGAAVDGWNITEGTKADAAYTSGSGSIVSILKGIYNAVTSSIPTGTNTIGNVGTDPSSGKGTPSSVAINVSTATTTQLVAISGTTKIYVTSYDVIAGGTGNITFEYGTGASCGTGTTALTGAYPLTAQAGIAKGSGTAAVLVVPAGNALCVLTSAAVQMSGSVSYQQF